ncbi:MAG: (Fe-S)-binding protein [Actinomycetota bacterium]
MSFIDCCDWGECNRCGTCLIKCPVMRMGKDEAKAEVGLLLEGRPAPRVFAECTLCYSCNAHCPRGLKPYELILERIAERNRAKRSISAMVPYFLMGMPGANFWSDVYGRFSAEDRAVLRRWSEPPKGGGEVLYMGCGARLFCGDIERSRVLAGLAKFGPPDTCCGEMHYRSASFGAYRDIAERLLARFRQVEADRVVFFCDSCHHYMTRTLPEMCGLELPFESVGLYQWLMERYEKGEISVENPRHFKAAISEPCYVSELGKDFYALLRAVYGLTGAELVELQNNRDMGLSCGMASFVKDNRMRDMIRCQRTKYRQAKEAGARELALNCYGCVLTMVSTGWMHGMKLRFMPQEILAAFGDQIRTPLASRAPLIMRTIAGKLPLLVKRIDPELPRIPP